MKMAVPNTVKRENGQLKILPKGFFMAALMNSGYIPCVPNMSEEMNNKEAEKFEKLWPEIETGFIPYYVNYYFGIDLPIPGNQMLKED